MLKKITFFLILFSTLFSFSQITNVGPVLVNPKGLCILDGYAYLYDDGFIKRVNLSDNQLSLVQSASNFNLYTIEEHPNGLVFTDAGSQRVALTNITNGSIGTTDFNYASTAGISGGSTGIAFYTNGRTYFTIGASSNRRELRARISATGTNLVAPLPANHLDIVDVAVDGTTIYFSTFNGTIYQFSLTNPNAGFTTFASGLGSIWGIEVTQDYLYYAFDDGNTSRVTRLRRSNGSSAGDILQNRKIVYLDIVDNVVYGMSTNSPSDRIVKFTDPLLPSPCQPPNNVTSQKLTSTRFDIVWQAAANASNYDVAIVENGQPIANATVTNVNGILFTANIPDPNKTYDVYVRTNCGNTVSNYSAPIQIGAPKIVYVDIDATGNNDGSSWANAYTSLNTALNAATNGSTIWLAEGSYVPGTNQNAVFNINRNISIYGGFDGTETQLSQRDFINNASILDGDINGDDNLNAFPFVANDQSRDDNARRVVNINASGVVFDGISIRGGHSFTTGFTGIAVAPTVSDFTITNSEITQNYAAGITSGIQAQPTVNATFNITNNRFTFNTSNAGTCIYIFTNAGITADIRIANNLFANNRIITDGNTFSGSAGWIRAFTQGSIINLDLANNTFAKNISDNIVAGRENTVFGISQNSGTMNANVVNNIFWGNKTPSNVTVTSISTIILDGATTAGNTTIASQNISEDGLSFFPSNNASTADPLFANLSNNDFTLQATSPAINAGNNNFAFGTTDILGLQRIANNVVDLGAYEFGSSPLNTTNFDISKATLYPNPTNQFINITIENQNIKKVNIFSMQGKKVLQSEKGKVNIQQLQTGVYLIKIETNEGGQFISKFIKK